MYILNKIGPKTGTYGTPSSNYGQDLKEMLLILVLCQ